MQIDFSLYHRGDLYKVRAHLREDCLSEDGGGATRVEEVLPTGETRLLGGRAHAKAPHTDAEFAALDAVEEICRVAAALAHKPWADTKASWPKWSHSPEQLAKQQVAQPREALFLACLWFSYAQRERHEAGHPTGPSDEAVYRKEAPYGSER